MIAAAGQSAELAHLTKDAVLLAASQYRNLPPHHADATSADQAYRRVLPTRDPWSSLGSPPEKPAFVSVEEKGVTAPRQPTCEPLSPEPGGPA